MKNFFIRRFGKISDYDIAELETQLESSLRPVTPSREFMAALEAGLVAREIRMASFPAAARKFSNGLLVVGGVLGSVLMIIASIRGLVSLFGLIASRFPKFSREIQVRQSQQTTLIS